MAIRIQRQRTKGWRMPPGAVYVGRPTKFGNPINWREYDYIREPHSDDPWRPPADACRRWAVTDFKAALLGWDGTHSGKIHGTPYPTVDEIREALHGKDLACWCHLSEPCHADVLLDVANSTGKAGR